MKIEMELKDTPRGRPTKKIFVDQRIHKGLHVSTIVSAIKRQYPWVKIIDIRVDLR